MATKKSQRIGILIIAVLMIVSTIALFATMVLSNQNMAIDQKRAEELRAQYMKEYEEYTNKVNEQDQKYSSDAEKYSDRYYSDFLQYTERVGRFDAESVTDLEKVDLKKGDGKEVKSGDSVVVYYIGWNPKGKIFDQSIEDRKLKAPFVMRPGSVIEGWEQGLEGVKVGGVRELHIPAELAYGDMDRGEDIPANTPLKFVVMVIDKLEAIEQPEMSDELLRYYQQGLLTQ